MSRQRRINVILVVLSIVTAFFSAVIYTLKWWDLDNVFTIFGTLMIIFITIANDVVRITKTRRLTGFLRMLHFWGICSFLLIIPHTGETGSVTRAIEAGTVSFGPQYLIVAVLGFLVLLVMALTSIQGFQPKWWKRFHRIIWMALPFIALHLWFVEYYLMALLCLLPMFLPLCGLLFNRVNLKIYFTQLALLVSAIIIIGISYVWPTGLLIFLRWSFIFVPVAMILWSIFVIDNKDMRKLLFKYFMIFMTVILIIVITL